MHKLLRVSTRHVRNSFFVVLTWALAALPLFAEDELGDWPQFRGPGGWGVSMSDGLPVTWSSTENVAWRTSLPGAGTSSPIVVGDKIFLTCHSGYGVSDQSDGNLEQLKLHLLCLNRDNGAILWNTEVTPKLPEQAKIRENHGYASSTPASDGERIYVFFGKSGVFAFDFDGQQLWQADVGSELSGWGSAASPVLYGDLVIVNASVESQSLVALDKKTGDEKWRAPGITDAWNTPVLVPLKGGKTELVVAMAGKVLAFDPASGDPLWSCANDITWYIAPSIVANDGVLWTIGGRSGVAAAAIRAGGRGDVTKSHRLWTGLKGSNVSSPVFHDGYLYWMHDNQGIAYCAEAKSGKIMYEKRIDGADQVYASAVLAAGKLYYVTRGGRTFVFKASPKFEQLAVNDLEDAGVFNASPGVAGNQLLLRSDRFLFCLGEK